MHCVSQDFEMNNGISLKFKNKYNHVNELKAQNKQIGQIAYLNFNSQFIIYFITKSTFYEKLTYKLLFIIHHVKVI